MEQRVERLETEVRELESDVMDIKTRLAVAESNIQDIKEDISSIKNNTTWIIRLIVAGFVSLIFTLFKMKGGL